ncbi:hypothetical protein T492DRAFT_844850 [Pavlovales sp. CCMP2436]|nr:hypothetical protein T492DRAFT_844850 [Pavlovales sp. CCMP2436]
MNESQSKRLQLSTDDEPAAEKPRPRWLPSLSWPRPSGDTEDGLRNTDPDSNKSHRRGATRHRKHQKPGPDEEASSKGQKWSPVDSLAMFCAWVAVAYEIISTRFALLVYLRIVFVADLLTDAGMAASLYLGGNSSAAAIVALVMAANQVIAGILVYP